VCGGIDIETAPTPASGGRRLGAGTSVEGDEGVQRIDLRGGGERAERPRGEGARRSSRLWRPEGLPAGEGRQLLTFPAHRSLVETLDEMEIDRGVPGRKLLVGSP